MPFEMIERVVADTATNGLEEIIPSTMGEPLLYEHFEGILGLCERFNVKLNLTTNGSFPRLGAEAWALKIVPFTSDIKISWNGATKSIYESIMVGGCWEKALDNVRTFIRVRDEHASKGGNRCRVTFQLTFLEKNISEIADIVRLASDLGIDRVKGHHLWVHFDELKEESMRRSTEAIHRWNQIVFDVHEAAAESALSNGRHVLLENFFQLDEMATNDIAPGAACPFLGQEAWVSAEGRFDPCCAPDAKRRKLGEFGNLHDHGFMEIWNGEAYRRLTTTYMDQRLCLGCNMRKPSGDS